MLHGSFSRAGLGSDPAEIQGMLCGMLAGGMALENRGWLNALADFINQGEPFSESVNLQLKELYDDLCQQLLSTDFGLTLLIPDDNAPINERGQALIKWVQGFMLGFGLEQNDLTKCSDDVKEALEDFSEISRMDEEMLEGEESEQALFEVMEYVRISAMLCFNELGKSADEQQSEPKTLH
ncbi:UPF0149 family protein [Bowmanella sp. JS7-9]|uniref:UPF0149 family protein n=1 Tax=Pseudobowmanella zhangzhouensis TaxID=1537679 RepID=A0ABW1XFK3_9ALTE|nr:UPF0149 family protein [Bowmanella sp. JS7-9]TBX21448.1 hypothetical protein TK45_12390 [Bowmanella sp. JS7-9]